MAEIEYKKYDKGGVSPKAPTTQEVRTMPGTGGTPRGSLTKALKRGSDIDEAMGYNKKKKK